MLAMQSPSLVARVYKYEVYEQCAKQKDRIFSIR